MGDTPSRRHVWRHMREYGLKGAAPYPLHGVARKFRRHPRYVPAWLTPESAHLYHHVRDRWAWKRYLGPRWWAFQCDLLTTWRERMGAYDFLRQRAQLAGVETRQPLLDDLDLIELALRIPPELAFDPELTRPLARAALVDLVPDAIRLRRDKSDFNTVFVDSLDGTDLAIGAELLRGRDAEVFEVCATGGRPLAARDTPRSPEHHVGLVDLAADDDGVLAPVPVCPRPSPTPARIAPARRA